jgi:integrase
MSTKNANGEGSVRSKARSDGRWEARYTVQVEGVWKRRTVYGRTREDAGKRLREALTARDNGALPAPARETVGTYLEGWLAGAEATVRPRTRDSYRQIVRTHLIPRLGRIAITKLGPQQVQRMYGDLLEAGLSPKTIANVHGVLHRALQQAFRWRILPTNVADLVDPPRVPRREMKALSPDQARDVLRAAENANDPLEALYRLAISAGLRQGELLALRWPDVDLDRGAVRVVATLEQRRGQTPVLAQPKSDRSRRQVDLGPATVGALRAHKAEAIKDALASGQTYDRTGFVFSRPDGRPLSMSIVGKSWTRLNALAGVPQVRFHDLRHTAATLLLSRGVHPKVVSELLGHSTVAITLDVYSHVIPSMQREAAQVMDDLLGG